MSDRKHIPGKFVWFELMTKEPKKAQAFYGEVLGWKTLPFPMGNFTYEMICTGETPDTMIGGYTPPKDGQERSRWIASVSVDDVDRATKAAIDRGGRVIDPPADIPNVGRAALIADAQGAELSLFKSASGDSPDTPEVGPGRFLWNELHTHDPVKALAFYQAVVGFTHRSVDMGSDAGVYHIISRDGVDRGGVTHHLSPGAAPHWLPYVSVDDVDATIARAKRLGATIPNPAADIPGTGRFGVLQDPTGATLAIMKPLPREKQR